ncbi:MAG: hypothetical protein GX483_03220 [Actinomycetaceae bacterium]|nr:hypothetical protein [Actinomycetaceae bacterium]
MIIAIIRLHSQPVPTELVRAIAAGGIGMVEVTLTTPRALETIAQFADDPEITIGAGTVRDGAGARAAAAAGAKFFVTPTIDADVLDIALDAGIDVYCGAMTPTEIETAYRHPAVQGVKVFPVGALGGPQYIKAIREPLNDIPLIPTGGVDAVNAVAYRRLGCAGIGVGGSLVSDNLVNSCGWAEITARATDIVTSWEREK